MCGRYTLYSPLDDIISEFGHSEMGQFKPTYNAAPSQDLPILESKNGLRLHKWGFIPNWGKNKDLKYQINARSETAAEKPFFRDAFKTSRCVIPISGFYEWTNKDGRKAPLYFTSEKLIYMAGLYSDAGFCILTKAATGPIGAYHHRMPVMIPRDRLAYWLNCAPQDALRLTRSASAKGIGARFVSTDVNSPRNNYPELLS